MKQITFHFSYIHHGELPEAFPGKCSSPSSEAVRRLEDLFGSGIKSYALSPAENLEGKTPMDISKGLNHTESIELVSFFSSSGP